jgi:hypothetical protein
MFNQAPLGHTFLYPAAEYALRDCVYSCNRVIILYFLSDVRKQVYSKLDFAPKFCVCAIKASFSNDFQEYVVLLSKNSGRFPRTCRIGYVFVYRFLVDPNFLSEKSNASSIETRCRGFSYVSIQSRVYFKAGRSYPALVYTNLYQRAFSGWLLGLLMPWRSSSDSKIFKKVDLSSTSRITCHHSPSGPRIRSISEGGSL